MSSSLAIPSLVLGGLLGGAMFGAPETATAIEQLPEPWWWFLFDVTVLTWVFVAFGEELVFRGFLLQRLESLFGLKGPAGVWVPAVSQGAIFGMGHASQGMTGIIMTGIVGVALGVYFMTWARRSLVPMVLGHGIIDSTALTIAWLN